MEMTDNEFREETDRIWKRGYESAEKEYRQKIDAALLQTRLKDETIRKLCEALTVRRAMEPKHSDLEHTCPECELVAEIIHSERMEKRICVCRPMTYQEGLDGKCIKCKLPMVKRNEDCPMYCLARWSDMGHHPDCPTRKCEKHGLTVCDECAAKLRG